MQDDDIICTCMNISVKDIKNAIAAGAKNFLDVQKMTSAGTICGLCIDDVELCVKQLLKQTEK